MNDTTYLLDEGLTKLVEIHEIEVEMEDKTAWAAASPQHRQEREGVMRTAQRQASSYIALGNETVNMLAYMTQEIKEPFLSAEIVDRLATMLDYNLVILVGEKMSTLKVRYYVTLLTRFIQDAETHHIYVPTCITLGQESRRISIPAACPSIRYHCNLLAFRLPSFHCSTCA